MGSLKWFVVGIILSAVLSVDLCQAAKEWWETSSLYQIYPRSFKDSDGDGIGDIKGITQNLQYLKDIGVTGTWLSPIFKSPMADFGYDISDFYDIQPEYGTLADFDELVREAHKLGIKIILDFVPNHSSDECEWFLKSINKEPGFEDFYVWHPGFPDPNNPSKRLPPNNWVSVFRGPAWTWREERQEFYLHQFDRKQPDLNYRNPQVVEQMKDVLRFWYRRGADGFRIDAVPHLFEIERDFNGNFKDEPRNSWTNDPNDYGYTDHIFTTNRPETIDMVYQWRKVTDDFVAENGGDTKVLLTEAWSPLDVIWQYFGNGTHQGAHIPFNFMFINDLGWWSSAYDYKNIMNTWMFNRPEGSVPNWVIGNHDKPRVGTRFGKERIDLINMMMLVMPGVTVTYNGEEIGMTDVYIPWEETVDPQACNTNPAMFENFSRDPCRTPFQWDDSTSAGFSTNPKTWLRIAEDYREVNVKRQMQWPKSHLQTYIRTKNLRQTETFKDGDFGVWAANDKILIIKRELAGQPTYVYIANVGEYWEREDLTSVVGLPENLEVVVSSSDSSRKIGDIISPRDLPLVPYEAIIAKSV